MFCISDKKNRCTCAVPSLFCPDADKRLELQQLLCDNEVTNKDSEQNMEKGPEA